MQSFVDFSTSGKRSFKGKVNYKGSLWRPQCFDVHIEDGVAYILHPYTVAELKEIAATCGCYTSCRQASRSQEMISGLKWQQVATPGSRALLTLPVVVSNVFLLPCRIDASEQTRLLACC